MRHTIHLTIEGPEQVSDRLIFEAENSVWIVSPAIQVV